MNILRFVIISCFLFSISHLSAEVFGTAGTLKPGTFMLGFEPEITMEPTDFQINFHAGFGLVKDLDLGLRFAAGTANSYIGTDLEFQLVRTRNLDFSLALGTHYQAELFLDFTPMLSIAFKRFSISTGPDFNWQLSGRNRLGSNWFFGAAIPLRKSMEFVTEFGLNISNYYHWISSGIALYF